MAAMGGQVTRETIERRLAARDQPLRRAESAPELAAALPVGAPGAPAIAPNRVALSPIRRRVAANLRRSLDTAAHTLVVTEADYSGVERARARAQTKLSYLPFVARAVIDALTRYPQVNATLHDDGLELHPEVNLGISVDLDHQGLVVPVVRRAGDMRLAHLGEQIRDLAARARAKQLGPDAFAGGTFTITNAGGYGTVVTAPIINPGQVAILSTDGVRMRPVAVPDGSGGWSVAVRPVGNLSLSFDHRAFDGAYAAAFLAEVRESLSGRDWESEL